MEAQDAWGFRWRMDDLIIQLRNLVSLPGQKREDLDLFLLLLEALIKGYERSVMVKGGQDA